MPIDRRSLLSYAAALPLAGVLPRLAGAAEGDVADKADYTVRIATGLVELSPEYIVSTSLYNGQYPGPLIRLTEGKRVVVDIFNDNVPTRRQAPACAAWAILLFPA
jgi:FtsP/CotA-like multicopper oxidase with cupredoxin domain